MISPPLAFIRKVSLELPDNSAIPLFGKAAPFDWSHFSSLLASRFALSHFDVRPKEQRWRGKEELSTGLGAHYFSTFLTLTPLSSPVYWVMSHADIKKLTSLLLSGNGKTSSFSSEILQEGFYSYLLAEALDAAIAKEPLQEFTPQMGEEVPLPEIEAFAIDIEISLDKKSCWGRLFLPSPFQKEWVRHFAHLPSQYTPSEVSKQTPLVIAVNVGSLLLRQSEWKALQAGDFLPLERSGYDAKKQQGIALLVLGATPLFQAKIKQNRIELLDYAIYQEETMAEKPAEAAQQEPTSLKDIPLTITVEIARLKISLDQLMALSPGNALELPIHPEQGVSLSINGQVVGRAELVYLGEVLGIRILEMG